MRRFLIVALLAVALFAVVAPPVFAQAPAPKVTITGLFDQVTSAGSNFYDGNYSRNNDREWYARTRFRPDFVFEVGRTKAVLGLEMDVTYGQTTPTGAGPAKGSVIANDQIILPGAATPGAAYNPYPGPRPGTTADSGLNNDVTGIIELKWFYTEFDLTGKDSLLPFIPVQTVARAGGQPFSSLANSREYATYAGGDFAGFSATTTWQPNLNTKFAYVMVEEELAGQNRNGAFGTVYPAAKWTRGEDFAIIVSPEYTPFKGLMIKPMYSYFFAQGQTSSQARRTAVNRFSAGGSTTGAATYATNAALIAFPFAGVPATYAAGDPALHENRHTIGGEVNWTMGAFAFKPVLYYQWGSRDTQCMCPDTVGGGPYQQYKNTAWMSSWLLDMVGSFQTGPFLLEVRGIYSTGNEARDNLAKRISYFEPLDEDTSYYTGWAQILALGTDYFLGLGGVNGGMSTNVGYDRYGRAQLGVRGTYNLTPALALWTIVSPTWTAEPVDTKTGIAGTSRSIMNDKSFTKGDSSYIGTEWDLGTTWRFAPNTAFDFVGAWLFAGGALDTTECVRGNGPTSGGPCGADQWIKRNAQDAWALSSRVRLAF